MRKTLLGASIAAAILSLTACEPVVQDAGTQQLYIDGQVIDPHIAGSSVWLDINGNGSKDSFEKKTNWQGKTDSSGNIIDIVLPSDIASYPDAQLVSEGGIDLWTSKNLETPLYFKLSDIDFSKPLVISPFSTLIASSEEPEKTKQALEKLGYSTEKDFVADQSNPQLLQMAIALTQTLSVVNTLASKDESVDSTQSQKTLLKAFAKSLETQTEELVEGEAVALDAVWDSVGENIDDDNSVVVSASGLGKQLSEALVELAKPADPGDTTPKDKEKTEEELKAAVVVSAAVLTDVEKQLVSSEAETIVVETSNLVDLKQAAKEAGDTLDRNALEKAIEEGSDGSDGFVLEEWQQFPDFEQGNSYALTATDPESDYNKFMLYFQTIGVDANNMAYGNVGICYRFEEVLDQDVQDELDEQGFNIELNTEGEWVELGTWDQVFPDHLLLSLDLQGILQIRADLYAATESADGPEKYRVVVPAIDGLLDEGLEETIELDPEMTLEPYAGDYSPIDNCQLALADL